LYYARLERPFVDEPIEVVLHGVVSEDQARAAFEVLITPLGHDGRQSSDL
jgi:hypothetical protein